jgi:hypothetical protein
VKEVVREQKRENKDKVRAEKVLRKTMRKQGELREDFNDGVLQDLVAKYSKKTIEEFDQLRAGLELAEDVKREQRDTKTEAKHAEKQRIKHDKTDEKQRIKHDKAEEKQRIKHDKTEEKQRIKHDKAEEKAKKKTMRKLRPSVKIQNRKTAKKTTPVV